MPTPTICSKISSRRFTWHKELRSFSCDASELDHHGENTMRQVWPDSCDAGFIMVGQKTGIEIIFCLDEDCTSREGTRDGEITHWIFSASNDCVRREPKLANVTVNIWNT